MGSDDEKDERSEHPLQLAGPAMLGEIVALLTHDLRNPLAALSSNVGYLNMLGQGLPTDVREAIFDLQLSIEVLSRISDTMEVISQELRGLDPPLPGRASVHGLIAVVRQQAERAALSHGVTLLVETGPDLRVRVAEPAFSRTLSSLLQNSISLAPSGSEVRLTASAVDEGVSFRIEDQGVALGPDLASRAFTAEGQVEVKHRAEGRYSRGLGLYMAGRCAALAGAKVRALSREQGNAFELLAPLAE